MSEIGDAFAELRRSRKVLREKFGIICPRCVALQPKRIPSTLLPMQMCRVDGWRYFAPRLTRRQRNQAYRDAGLDIQEVD